MIVEDIMTHSQEARVSSSQDTFRVEKETISSVSALVSKLNSCSAIGADGCNERRKGDLSATNNLDARKTQETFPWLSDFWETCRSSVGTKNVKVLENLILEYLAKVSGSVKDCYMKPNRAAKLKKSMNDVLVFFHLCYHDMQESMEHSTYLDRMTELVSMYLDMEIKASRRRKESVKKIAWRLSSSLNVLLDNSEEHMLDAILKAKFINKHHRELCAPLLGKILNRSHTYNMYETLYVRYLLVFKLWKKVVANADERRRINKLAVAKLIPPPHFVEKSKLFNTVLPKIPKSKKNVTMFFMQAKFNLKAACVAFLKTCRESQQPGFSQALALSIDKPVFYADGRANSPTGLDEKDIGGGSGSLINDIWSSICNVGSALENNSQLKDLEVEKQNMEQVVKKKKIKDKSVKKKVKKKKDDKKVTSEENPEKMKKKKLKKKIIVGFGEMLLGSSVASNISLLKKLCKGDKAKKTKKKKILKENSNVCPVPVGDIKTNECDNLLGTDKESEKQLLKETVEVKVETSVSSVKEIDSGKKEGFENTDALQKESVCVGTTLSVKQNSLAVAKDDSIVQINEPLNQVDLVNSASSNETSILSVPKDKIKKVSSENERSPMNQVHIVNSAGSEEAFETQRRVIVKVVDMADVVQPSSSSSPPVDVTAHIQLPDVSVGSSQLVPVTTENEALATKHTEVTNTDIVMPKVVRDPVLVSSQTANSQVPDTVSYVCDSSVKNEVPLPTDVCTPGVSLYNEAPMDIDADEQMLSDLASRGGVKCDGEEDEEVLPDEFIRRDNIDNLFNTGNNLFNTGNNLFNNGNNLFNTGNEAFVIELLGDLPEHNMTLSSSPHVSHDSSDGETLDPFETAYLNNMMNNFFNAKEDFSQEKQECILRGVSSATKAAFVNVQTEEPSKKIMEGDGGSTDEETENYYECQNSRPQSDDVDKNRLRAGGKVIPTAVISSTGSVSVTVKDKELAESPSRNDIENDTSHNDIESDTSRNGIENDTSCNNIEIDASCNGIENETSCNRIENGTSHNGIENDTSHNGIENDTLCNGIENDTSCNGIENDTRQSTTADDSFPNSKSNACEISSIREAPSQPHITANSTPLSSASSTSSEESQIQTIDNYTPVVNVETRTQPCAERIEVPEPREEDVATLQKSSPEKALPRSLENTETVREHCVETVREHCVETVKEHCVEPIKENCVEDTQYQSVTVTVSEYNTELAECLPSVESDSCKVSEQPVKELPKPSQRGMFVENNNSRGKLTYTNLSMQGMYPYTYPAPVQMSKFLPAYPECACSECYSNYYLRLSNYNAGLNCYESPLQYTSSDTVREMEKLKAEDQELLRKIEESLIADKSVKCEKPNDEYESKCKTDIDSSLPLKKRLTMARVQAETKIKKEHEESKKLDGFPSYPRKPMMSIAELEKVHSFAKYIKYPGNNKFYRIENYNVLPADYPPEEIVVDVPDKKPPRDIMHHYVRGVVPPSVVEHSSHRSVAPYAYRQVLNPCQDPRYSQSYQSEYTTGAVSVNSSQVNYEYSGRQFKTPAQLKEIPEESGTYISYSAMKKEDDKSSVLLDQRNSERTPDAERAVESNRYIVPKCEVDYLSSREGYSTTKHSILDLSVEDENTVSETKTHKSSRKKRCHTSDSHSKSSGKRSRSRNQSVIQKAETVDDFMKSFENKRKRKNLNR
ncbi:uncharacterized protein LOC126187333 [Schistocerca cancellata]|uniref:uncharacterized protein LOC126187333 n=1 Tax=Schistocerca cancellata TaxID=274614 RepID=UPI00211755DA|nr:uncharacterized protein LOC126187333 [Schistocerca cancellata]